MRTPKILLATVLALSAIAARADTVEASSTTYFSAGKQPRGGVAGQTPDLVNVMPIVEVLTLSARGVKNPLVDNLEFVVSTWGSMELQDPRWDTGTSGKLNGDVLTGYVKGQLFARRLTFRLGRENVPVGAGRVASIDGGDVALRLPFGVGLSAYAGVPVAQRFTSYGNSSAAGYAGTTAARSWNAMGGDLAYGGRASLSLVLPLAFLKSIDVGGSAAFVDDGGQKVRRDAGVDARIRLLGDLAVNAWALYALEAARLAEVAAVATWHPLRTLLLTADYKKTAPDLMLPMTSILTVFAESERQEVGGGFRWNLTRSVEGGVDYHALLEPSGDGTSTKLGHEVTGRGDYRDGPVRAGGELTWLKALDNGYGGGRCYARREFGRLFAAADVQAYVFDKKVNGQDYSATFGATAGWQLAKNWTASLTGRAGTTPFMESQVDVMAKLTYNQSVRQEVR
jgi:hypothetical protein